MPDAIHRSIDPSRRSRSTVVNWLSVATFYGVACAISWPLFWWRDRHRASFMAWDAPGFVKGWAPALGPALAAILALYLFRKTHQRTVSLVGSSWSRSACFAAVPLLAITIVGIGDDEPHLTGLLSGLIYFVYGLGEELGWRGFLQDAVRPLAPVRRYLTIGLLWGAWHFTTFTHGETAQVASRLGMMVVLWVLGSWGIGKAVDKSHSLVVAAILHLIFNFIQVLPGATAWYVLGPSAVAWVVLLRRWKSETAPETEIGT